MMKKVIALIVVACGLIVAARFITPWGIARHLETVPPQWREFALGESGEVFLWQMAGFGLLVLAGLLLGVAGIIYFCERHGAVWRRRA
jgi:hypothetical protein